MTDNDTAFLSRAELLLGRETMDALSRTRVILFGTGGVGSWCAESLVRSGIGHLTLVDFDRVNASNVNRQMMATSQTLGEVKVEALRRRLLDIRPDVRITTVPEMYTPDTAGTFDLDGYDYVVDAIDSLDHKALLIRKACASKATLFSSMGAARKLDPTKVAVAEFWKVKGCPLGAALRRKFRQTGDLPVRKFQCVYSEEVVPNHRPADATGELATANGSLMHITAVFGCTLTSLILRDILQKSGAD